MHDLTIARESERRTVLVVDDDALSRAYLAEALEGMGLRTLQAADGGEALRILTEASPDFVCADLMMPGMDGLEFLNLARARVPGLPLVFVTGCDEAEAAGEALHHGAAAFLRKPVSLGDLARVLEQLPRASGQASQGDTSRLLIPSTGRIGGNGDEKVTGHSAARSTDPLAQASRPGELDATLLRKATQLSFLTQFGAALRDIALTEPADRSASSWAAPELGLTGEGSAPAVGQSRVAGIAPLVQRSLDFILQAMPGSRAALALTDGPGVQPISARGDRGDRLPLGTLAARTGDGGSSHPWHGILDGMPLAAAPLTIGGAAVGFVCVGRDPGAPAFTWADGELLAAFSAQMAVTLENACLGRQLERAFQDTVTSLVVTLEARDKYTEGHSLRVAHYAAGTAATLELPLAVCEQVRTASLLHDLGKVGVRDAILDKPGPLTSEEWTAMRQHPVLGWKILGPLGFLAEEAQGVRHHHERFDGRGYPDGLAGNAIPLPARIIAVADSFDAMSSARPYRPAMSLRDSLAELGRNAGKQFDPTMVEAFRVWFAARSVGSNAA